MNYYYYMGTCSIFYIRYILFFHIFDEKTPFNLLAIFRERIKVGKNCESDVFSTKNIGEGSCTQTITNRESATKNKSSWLQKLSNIIWLQNLQQNRLITPALKPYFCSDPNEFFSCISRKSFEAFFKTKLFWKHSSHRNTI